jgi:hypothetical protein
MNSYTGCEYLMIDAATQFGLSKATFEERIEWTKTNLNNLENLLPQAKEKPLYLKAVNAIRDTQAGLPIGHLVGLDASSSGLQIMSAVMGCYEGAANTGLVNPNEMPWAYKECTEIMKQHLGYSVDIDMDDVKQAVMTFYYGSEAKPKEIFIEGSPAYVAFFKAAKELAPEAFDLRGILINIWQPFVLEHSWTMPDGFEVKIKVMQRNDTSIKVPELNSSFTHIFIENEGSEKGLSLAANAIHSIDGMLVREVNRRCNYNLKELENCLNILATDKRPRVTMFSVDKTEMVLMSHIKLVTQTSVKHMDIEFITRLENLIQRVLSTKPFEVVCVHDEYKAHANNMDTVRYWYTELLAELADSHIMQNIIRQICKNDSINLTRASEDLGDFIRKSNYALG